MILSEVLCRFQWFDSFLMCTVPYSRAAAAGGVPPGLDFSNLGDSELQSLLNSMNQQQLMQLFGGEPSTLDNM